MADTVSIRKYPVKALSSHLYGILCPNGVSDTSDPHLIVDKASDEGVPLAHVLPFSAKELRLDVFVLPILESLANGVRNSPDLLDIIITEEPWVVAEQRQSGPASLYFVRGCHVRDLPAAAASWTSKIIDSPAYGKFRGPGLMIGLCRKDPSLGFLVCPLARFWK
jgi:hypothetical protein